MKTIVKILAFCAVISISYSVCNTCSALTGLACVATDKFSFCVNGLPTTTVVQCPNGTVCTDTYPVCSPAGINIGSCTRCGTCNPNNVFACTSYNTFSLCYGTTVPNTVQFTCAGNLVCNIDNPNICVNPTLPGIGGTCPSVPPSTTVTPTPTTTVSPTINPQSYCATLASSGRYEITTDPYCKKYVVCALANSKWIGNIYECPGSTFFNATSRLCVVEIPQRCASAQVSRIILN